MLLLLNAISLLLIAAHGCHPECRYACDDPVCPAVCTPVLVEPIKCNLLPKYYNEHYTTNCSYSCQEDACESEQCPSCEVRCTPPKCAPNCQIQCEQIAPYWYCEKPKDCPLPKCELQCEKPACVAPQDYIPTNVTTTPFISNSNVQAYGALLVVSLILFVTILQ